jgi:general secretion pathway protein F
MAAFEYTALDAKGRTRKGVLEGDTARQIRQQLREQGLSPLTIDEVMKASQQQRRSHTRVGAADLALFTRQLATLVKSGLALEEALRAISEQTEKARLKSLLLAVRARVLEGHSLAEGLALFPKVFPELYRATVAAGEQSGHLDIVLERLADYTETRQHIRQKTLLALFYPALLTTVALLVVVGLLAYVVPQVVQVFLTTRQELPLLTRLLIGVSDFLKDWGGILLLLLVAGIMGFSYLLRYESFLKRFHHLLLHLPLIARLERGANVSRFTRTLSILMASSVPLLDALRITAEVVSNRLIREAILLASDRVREGSSLHDALAASGLFPPMTVYLIASGESSGRLDEMLERAATTQERELESLIAIFLGLFEPLLILLMGGVVLTIVLAILMPIFELNQLVQ